MSATNLFIHAPSTLVSAERRLPSTIPLYDLKFKLEPIVGIPPFNQILEFYNDRTDVDLPCSKPTLILSVVEGSDHENLSLDQLSIKEGMSIKVLDTRPKELIQTFTDESLVEKYEMDDDTYSKRTDTVLAFKQRNKLGRFDPSKDGTSSTDSNHPSLPSEWKPGARCQIDLVSSSSSNKRRGTIRFLGSTKFATGLWVGVEYDEPVGKNDGLVDGERYFTCNPNFGSFVRPENVTVGDFPVEEIDLDDFDDDEEM